MFQVWTLTNDIQKCALTVIAKNRELNRERKRTDALLVQTLPRSIVDGLRKHQKFHAKFYRYKHEHIFRFTFLQLLVYFSVSILFLFGKSTENVQCSSRMLWTSMRCKLSYYPVSLSPLSMHCMT